MRISDPNTPTLLIVDIIDVIQKLQIGSTLLGTLMDCTLMDSLWRERNKRYKEQQESPKEVRSCKKLYPGRDSSIQAQQL